MGPPESIRVYDSRIFMFLHSYGSFSRALSDSLPFYHRYLLEQSAIRPSVSHRSAGARRAGGRGVARPVACAVHKRKTKLRLKVVLSPSLAHSYRMSDPAAT